MFWGPNSSRDPLTPIKVTTTPSSEYLPTSRTKSALVSPSTFVISWRKAIGFRNVVLRKRNYIRNQTSNVNVKFCSSGEAATFRGRWEMRFPVCGSPPFPIQSWPRRSSCPQRTRGAQGRSSAPLRRPVWLRCPRAPAPRPEGGRRACGSVCLRACVSVCERWTGVTQLGVSFRVVLINSPLGDHGNFFLDKRMKTE